MVEHVSDAGRARFGTRWQGAIATNIELAGSGEGAATGEGGADKIAIRVFVWTMRGWRGEWRESGLTVHFAGLGTRQGVVHEHGGGGGEQFGIVTAHLPWLLQIQLVIYHMQGKHVLDVIWPAYTSSYSEFPTLLYNLESSMSRRCAWDVQR